MLEYRPKSKFISATEVLIVSQTRAAYREPVGVQQRYNRISKARDKLYIGFDVGSTSSDVVALDDDLRVVFYDYRRTLGRPIETLAEQMRVLLEHRDRRKIALVAATGTVGRSFAELVGVPFINEVLAQAAAIHHLYPRLQRATILEMGGQDSKLIFLDLDQGRGRVRDFALNTVCAAGTGSFLDQQAQRLGIDIESQFGNLALQSKSPPRIAGRCSVFAKSDMIHLQQQATPMYDIIAGLCLGLARNMKSNLLAGRDFQKPVVFTGGVAANAGVVKALREVFELDGDELLVPERHFFTGAIGAVLLARDGRKPADSAGLEQILSALGGQKTGAQTAPRRGRLPRPTLPPPESPVYEHLLVNAQRPINAFLGVDVGSISTNVAVIDEENRLLAKAYLMTAGQPLEAIRQGLGMVNEKVAGKVNILGAATTGSGRYLTGDFIGADIVINEITAQAAGAAIVNPKVDTIFEIGGQDSKYISLENGVVVDFEMNHACAAGTGSFLEEQAQRLDIKIDREFAELAFASDAPIRLGERCTVFMESDLLSYLQKGAETRDLVAGLSYSIVANYLNRVVGRRKIGDNICLQGGTAFNHAVWAAFEKVTCKPVMVPDHHEVTGAIGAAAIAAKHMKNVVVQTDSAPESKFKGFESLAAVEYTVETFTCEHCPNNCEVKRITIPGSEPLYYGSRCDRYNIKKQKTEKASHLAAFDYRRRKMFECAGLDGKGPDAADGARTIGIPIALSNWQFLPLFARFFQSLGFGVIVSGDTNKGTIRTGVETVPAQMCFPVKVAYGHIAELLRKQPDYLFVPSIVSMPDSYPRNKNNHLCPYVQTLPYQLASNLGDKLGRTKILTTHIRMGEGAKLRAEGFLQIAKQLNVAPSAARKALKKALSAQDRFEAAIRRKGREILANLGPDERLFVLVSRPYNGCDFGLNLQLPKKLARLGVRTIPMDMLDLAQAQLTDEDFHTHVYWKYGQNILRAGEIIRRDPRLYAVYLSNFACGPDSFMLTFFKDIMGEKPSLQLELDEHSADAGVITRLEAFLESLKNYHPSLPTRAAVEKVTGGMDTRRTAISKAPSFASATSRRTLYIPWMGDSAYGVAACFRGYGQPAEVLPVADAASLIRGRQFTTGKECLPCAITSGDMLKVMADPDCDPGRVAFFMPNASGPCRFGMYNCLQRLILKYIGQPDVPVVSPNQDAKFYREIRQSLGTRATGSFTKDIWIACVGVDLLQKLLLRLRPFAVEPGYAQTVYQKSLELWCDAVERRSSMAQLRAVFEDVARRFEAVELDRAVRKPRIGIVGEIYVRSHDFANQYLINRLEKLGAACDLAAVAEWIYYTNFVRREKAIRRGQLRNRIENAVEDYFQHRFERTLAGPLEEKFGRFSEHPTEHIIELARPYMHHSFEGEAILSIGKIVEYANEGFGGVVNVMPFTCMPSTIVSTQTNRISCDCDNMPILNLAFDGQEDPSLTTRLEAFVEQVRHRQRGNLTAAELTRLPLARRGGVRQVGTAG
jgi:predicted CoA-substrate-specific enzyme activase